MPSATGPSKLAFSTNIGKWGVPVDEKSDLARIDLTKGTLVAPVDQLTISIDKTPDGNGEIKIMWEGTIFTAGFSVKR